MVAVSLTPSMVAVMVALPPLIPVTRPVLVTVARALLLELHVTVRPVISRFNASNARAVS